MSAATIEERAFWRRTLEEVDQRPGDLERAMLLVERHGALAETLSRARAYAATAIDALSVFRDGVARRALTEAAVFATERRFLTGRVRVGGHHRRGDLALPASTAL